MRPLDTLCGAPVETGRFLLLAVGITAALAELHGRSVINKYIEPRNIVIDPETSAVTLTGFTADSLLPQEYPAGKSPWNIEATPAYMSPEQTGRTNRAVDYRTDLYSLGVTFYEMLTGTLPFQAGDIMEWVHCHIARTARPPTEVIPEIPAMLSDIVMKLLAKDPEERYQTASGLRYDLEKCLEQWKTGKEIEQFPLGEWDISEQLLIPQKLYGRERDINTLLSAFDRVVESGTPELVMVAGYSGIGKTSLVRQVYGPVVRERGFFISGKFDQYKRDVPYSMIADAFREMIRQILTESEERIGAWKHRIKEALGINGQLIVDIIPQAELIIGPQAPVAELPPTETQNRFNMFFRRFVSVFAGKEHPLVIFLDDLQWVDSAGLKLLEGNLTIAEKRLSMLWRRAGNLTHLAAVTCLSLDLYTTLDQSDRGIEVCLAYLRRVGIEWSPHPTKDKVREEYERIWRQLGSRPIQDLIDLPPMTDPNWRVTMDVLTALMPAALFTDENLLCLSIGRMANLSLEHGHCDGSSLAYVWLGMILGPYFGDFRVAFRFGKLGLDLVERGLDRFKARVYLCFANFVNPWTKHIRTSRELQRRAFDTATRIGDLTFAAYSCNSLITNLLASGEPLAEVQREAEARLVLGREMGFGQFVDIVTTQLRLVRTLRGLPPRFSSFNDEEFDEGSFEEHLEGDPRLAIGACWYWIRKLQACFHAGAFASALEAAAKAEPLLWTSPAFFEVAEYHFYAGLALAAHCDEASPDGRAQNMEALAAHHKQLKLWAENCPENFLNRYALVSAEVARLEGRELEAEWLYEEAIRSARVNGFIQNEGISNEVAARFYRARDFETTADAYLRHARTCYVRWGADGKVKQLDEQYPKLQEEERAAAGGGIGGVDALAVVKASQVVERTKELSREACASACTRSREWLR